MSFIFMILSLMRETDTIHRSPDSSPGRTQAGAQFWVCPSVWATMGDIWGQEKLIIKQVWTRQHTPLTFGGFSMFIAKSRLQELFQEPYLTPLPMKLLSSSFFLEKHLTVRIIRNKFGSIRKEAPKSVCVSLYPRHERNSTNQFFCYPPVINWGWILWYAWLMTLKHGP